MVPPHFSQNLVNGAPHQKIIFLPPATLDNVKITGLGVCCMLGTMQVCLCFVLYLYRGFMSNKGVSYKVITLWWCSRLSHTSSNWHHPCCDNCSTHWLASSLLASFFTLYNNKSDILILAMIDINVNIIFLLGMQSPLKKKMQVLQARCPPLKCFWWSQFPARVTTQWP